MVPMDQTLRKIFATLAFILALCLFNSTAFAAGSAPKFNPKGISGWAGVGFANFTVKSPEAGYKLDRGTSIVLGGEKGFNFANLYLTFGFTYLTTSGQSQYNYSTLSGE